MEKSTRENISVGNSFEAVPSQTNADGEEYLVMFVERNYCHLNAHLQRLQKSVRLLSETETPLAQNGQLNQNNELISNFLGQSSVDLCIAGI